MAQTAPEAPDRGDTEVEQSSRDRAGVHDVRRHDEQRHRQQDETLVEALEDLLARKGEIEAGEAEIDQRRQDDGVADRRSDAGQDEEGQQAGGEFEAHPSSPTWMTCSSSGGPLRRTLTKRQR